MIPASNPGAGFEESAPQIMAALRRVCDSGRYVLGPELEAFEDEFAEFCGARHCVGVGNGTDALALILRALEVGPGDEVVVPAYTAVATWMAVTMAGATPVGADVGEATYNLDAGAAAQAITSRTRAIVAVHMFGQPADMDSIGRVAADRGIALIEDAAQAHGARYRNAGVGSLARAASFSFYPTKNLGALGDGGAITTNDGELADRVRLLRSYGWRRRGASETLGVNSRLDELQAAVLRVKLSRIDEWNDRRCALAARYLAGLHAVSGVTAPSLPAWATPVWHQFVVGLENRAEAQAVLADAGVGTLVHYDPLPHLTPAFRVRGFKEHDFPVAERLSAAALSLPMYPQLQLDACDRVLAALSSAARSTARSAT